LQETKPAVAKNRATESYRSDDGKSFTCDTPYHVTVKCPDRACHVQVSFAAAAEALMSDVSKQEVEISMGMNWKFVFRKRRRLLPTTLLESKWTRFFKAYNISATAAEGRKRTDAINENMLPPFICGASTC
jgi:hypothetical protein